jgi:flagellar biosynthesis chaperone FliJ
MVDARISARLETEQKVVSELGKTFTSGAAQLTDQIRVLEAKVAELQRQVAELTKKNS